MTNGPTSTDEEGEEHDPVAQSEYLVTLQPAEGSILTQSVLLKRAECTKMGIGQGSAGLYPPHISVTGFFKATDRQAAEFASLLSAELAAALARAAGGGAKAVRPVEPGQSPKEGTGPVASEGEATTTLWGRKCEERKSGEERERAAEEDAAIVKVKQVLATDDGHVILDVGAPLIADLASALATGAAHLGANVRPKKVGHLSIATGRGAEERSRIMQLHADLDMRDCGWNLVFSRLLIRSDVDKLERDGKMHSFCDMLRLPIPRAAGCAFGANNEALATSYNEVMSSLNDIIIPKCKGLHHKSFHHQAEDGRFVTIGA